MSHALLDQDKWSKVFEKVGALWLHDGNPKRPHALTTAGKHSDGYFNGKKVVEQTNVISSAGFELAQTLDLLEMSDDVDRVVGPGTRGLIFAFCVANNLGFGRNPVPYAFVKMLGEGKDKRAEFTETSIRKGERVMLVDDVFTTGSSLRLTAEAVERAGGIVLETVFVLCNRSRRQRLDGKAVWSFARKHMRTWSAKRCPLCIQGSEAIHPKKGDNWARLNAEY